MQPKRILVLNGHPAKSSTSRQLALAYGDAATENRHEVRVLHLADLDFDPDYEFGGYKNFKPLEPHLEYFLESLTWCERFYRCFTNVVGRIAGQAEGVG